MTTKDNDPNETTIQASMESMGAGLMEVIIDNAMTTEGILKDIPIASTGVGILNAARAFKDLLFEKKLKTFLEELGDTTHHKRRSEVERIESDSSYKTKVGEKLLYIIDRSEDHETASIIGRLFAAYLRVELGYDDFLKASSIVSSLHAPDLNKFLSLQPSIHAPANLWAKKERKTKTFWGMKYFTKIEAVGELAFSGLYEIRSGDETEDAIIVVETDIAGKLRAILGENKN